MIVLGKIMRHECSLTFPRELRNISAICDRNSTLAPCAQCAEGRASLQGDAIIAEKLSRTSCTPSALRAILNFRTRGRRMSKSKPERIREKSLIEAARLGFDVNPSLPLLESGLTIRDVDSIVTRMCCLHAISAVAHDFDKATVKKWIRNEKLENHLADSEKSFLHEGGDVVEMRFRVNALFAIGWAAGVVHEFDFRMEVPESLAQMLPRLTEKGSSSVLHDMASLRNCDEVIAALDLSYCLHWAISDSVLRKRRPAGNLHPISIIERRRGFEWLLSTQDWDDVQLDT
jgi:hypothetical protein